MSTDKEHLSLPRLYGAPAHTPRRMEISRPELPLCPDDLPIENYRSPEDHALALQLLPRAYAGRMADHGQQRPWAVRSAGHRDTELRAKPLLLRALGGRLMRPTEH
jgi:hypothetical protein